MPENTGQASKPEEPKPEPSTPPSEEQGKARGKYVDYNNVSPQEAAIMLKRIRKRMSRVMRDLEVVMSILKYGANAGSQGAPQESGGQGQNSGYRNYRKNYGYRSYGNRQYGRYGNRQYKRRSEDEDEDVNYD
jgi:hypothetical protein